MKIRFMGRDFFAEREIVDNIVRYLFFSRKLYPQTGIFREND